MDLRSGSLSSTTSTFIWGMPQGVDTRGSVMNRFPLNCQHRSSGEVLSALRQPLMQRGESGPHRIACGVAEGVPELCQGVADAFGKSDLRFPVEDSAGLADVGAALFWVVGRKGSEDHL